MDIIEKIEYSEKLGSLTSIINSIENDLKELKLDIDFLNKQYVLNRPLLMKIRLNDSLAKVGISFYKAAINITEASDKTAKLGKSFQDCCLPIFSNFKNAIEVAQKKE